MADFLDFQGKLEPLTKCLSITAKKHHSYCYLLLKAVIISYCINTTKYLLRAIFKEYKLASSPLILLKANILFCGIDAITVLSYG